MPGLWLALDRHENPSFLLWQDKLECSGAFYG